MKRKRGRVTSSGAKAVFQGRVEPMASRFFEVEIAADVDTIDVDVPAGASFSGLVQIVAIEENGPVRDIVRSDKRAYRRRLANTRNGKSLSTVAVIISGGKGGGSVQVSLQSAEAAADVMITRWNSESGREYHLDPHGAAWTWVSPDLWFEPAAAGNFAVKVRLHNKGSKRADNVSCVLAYRKVRLAARGRATAAMAPTRAKPASANDTWHYVLTSVLCRGLRSGEIYPRFTRDDDVVQMTASAVRVLTGNSDRFSALNALRLIIHLVGDLHQPIHVGCGYIKRSTNPAKLEFDPQVAASQKLRNDRGGGRLILPTGGNLHSYWDGSLGSIGTGEDDSLEEGLDVAPPELQARFVQKLVDMTAALPPEGRLPRPGRSRPLGRTMGDRLADRGARSLRFAAHHCRER